MQHLLLVLSIILLTIIVGKKPAAPVALNNIMKEVELPIIKQEENNANTDPLSVYTSRFDTFLN